MQGETMSIEATKALVRRYHEEVWKRNTAIYEELLAPDCTFHGTGGAEELKPVIDEDFQGFPDITFTIEDMVAEGDKVVTRWTLRGTHQGFWNGVAPTGRPVAFSGITINRVVDGKIVDDWFSADFLGLLQQLGAVPQFAPTPRDS
jgi:predicted ester cyclase